MTFNCPLSESKAIQLMDVMALETGSRVLDAGCGSGAFLRTLVERHGVYGLGIDLDGEAIKAASQPEIDRRFSSHCEFRRISILDAELDHEDFDAGLCIGSTHAFGMGESAFPNTIREMTRLVKPGGQILIGEGYWKQPPSPEYLERIGEPVGIYRNHAENIVFAEEKGLIPLYALTSNADEWDHFEWTHRMRIEKAASESPDDPALLQKLKRSRQWRDGYLRWGRDTMGFGFYLFRKPALAE